MMVSARYMLTDVHHLDGNNKVEAQLVDLVHTLTCLDSKIVSEPRGYDSSLRENSHLCTDKYHGI